MAEFATESDLNNLGSKVNDLALRFGKCDAAKSVELENLKGGVVEVKESIGKIFAAVDTQTTNINHLAIGQNEMKAGVKVSAVALGVGLTVIQIVIGVIIFFASRGGQ